LDGGEFMSVKHYGIYIAWPPTVDLRHEGLGRYLAAFLKGASEQKDVSFSVVCPSWSHESLADLLEAEGVPCSSCHVVSPKGAPMVLGLYETWLRHSRRKKKLGFIQRINAKVKQQRSALVQSTVDRLVRAHSFLTLVHALWPLASVITLTLLLTPLWLTLALSLLLAVTCKQMLKKSMRLFRAPLNRITAMASLPKDDGLVRRMYRGMEQAEADRMQALINTMNDVKAWYCPTAFWPAFNQIQAPRLMCVPDVVLTDFAVGFSSVGGDRFLENFEIVEKAIKGGQHYVTYSADVKWSTLVDRYGVQGSQVSVVHHAPNDLSKWVTVRGFADGVSASKNYCRWLMGCALVRSSNLSSYTAGFANTKVKFLFYASQMRPNKNILNLLRAYEYLLRKRLIGQKLILTGQLGALPEIKRFIVEHNLENEVLFLHGLKIQELAALYRLADLVVNPSLSEGGCPFTFTEALSVGTPVVMARIPVTEEVLTEPELQAVTFFDPYDWRDMAERIEWALAHRDELLAIQKLTYERLAQRTWQNVVQEHIDVLDRIAEETTVE
jgi:glycosyltransferase involved in cell wall biosynthesis